MHTKIAKLLILLTILTISTEPVNAQQIGLSLSPSLTEINAKPGKNIHLTFNLENLSDPALVSLKLRSFRPTGSDGSIQIKDTNTSPILFDIQKDNPAEQISFIMKTHERKKIGLDLHIPQDIQEGDYYFSFLAQTDPPPPTEGNISARSSVAIASNILVSVSKTYPIEPRSKIILFTVPHAFHLNLFGLNYTVVDSQKPLQIILSINNTSIHRIKPDGIVKIKNNFGYEKNISLPPQNVLANSEKILKAAPEIQSEGTTLQIPKITVGSYSVSTSIAFPSSETTLQATLNILALPFTLVFFLSVIFLLTLIFFIFRKKKNPEFEEE